MMLLALSFGAQIAAQGAAPFATPAAGRATAFGQQGHAVVNCDVTPIGALRNCVVLSEDPKGQGVGDFALKLTHGYMIDPHDKRIQSGKIRIPMQFKMPKG